MRHTPIAHFKFLPALLLVIACTRPSPEQIKKDVDTSVDKNAEAKTLTEWESSEFTSEEIFKRWKDANALPEDVCKVLKEKTAENLTIFEEEIKNKENTELIKPCKEELIEKLEKYWKIEKAKLEGTNTSSLMTVPAATFSFPDNVQTRDVSHGYKAITGDVKQKEVIITFDDGPHPQYTDRILKALESVNAKVIFFSTGKSAKAYPQVLKRAANAGHAIGSHSVTHKCLPAKTICAKNNGRMLTYTEAINEIRGGHQAVYDAIGWVDPFFRFPYGESSPMLKEYLGENGIGEFFWAIDSADWKAQSPEVMINSVMKQLDQRQRGIILFHDIQRRTAESLPTILKKLYYKGYSIVLLKSANPDDRYNSKIVNLH